MMWSDAARLRCDSSVRSSSSSHGHALSNRSGAKGCLMSGARRFRRAASASSLRHSASLTNMARAFGSLCGAGRRDASPSSLAPARSDSGALLVHQAPSAKEKKQSVGRSSGKPRPPQLEAALSPAFWEESGHRPSSLPHPPGFPNGVTTEMSLASPRPSACTPSSPHDSDYGLANWQLGLETLLDVRKGDVASPLPSARHTDANVDTQLQLQLQRELTSLQAQVEYWKERAVQTMHDARDVKMKSARCALLFVWGIFRAWQRHAKVYREAHAGLQTEQ